MPTFERKYYHKAVYLNSYYFDYLELNWQMPQDINLTIKKDIVHSHLIHAQELIQSYIDSVFSDNNSYYNGGLTIRKSGQQLIFKFGGTFFRHTHYSKDWDYFYNLFTNIQGLLFEYWSNEPDLFRYDYPRFKISQIHISENLYHSKYKHKLNRKNISMFASSKVIKSMANKKGGAEYFLPSLKNSDTPPTITGYSIGGTGSAICTLYDKSLEPNRHHSIERFGTDRFYRREFKVYRKKLNSWLKNKRTPEHMNRLLKPFKEGAKQPILNNFSRENFAKLIRSIRVSVDILHKDDIPKYTIFHEKYLTSIKQFSNWLKNNKEWKHTKHPLLMTGMERQVPNELVKQTAWNPTKMVCGILNSDKAENITNENWRTIITTVTESMSKYNTFHVIDRDVIENEALVEFKRAVLKFNQAFK